VPSRRSVTPDVTNLVHFNNAGFCLPRLVLDAVTSHLAREGRHRRLQG
jgi:hypothetical protein